MAELSILYGDILESMNSAGPRFPIVNNEPFICWLATHETPADAAGNDEVCSISNELPEQVLDKFFTEAGA